MISYNLNQIRIRLNSRDGRALATGILFAIGMILLSIFCIFFKVSLKDLGVIRLPILLNTAEGLSKGTEVYVQGLQIGYVSSFHHVSKDLNGRIFLRTQEPSTPVSSRFVLAVLNVTYLPDFYPNYRIFIKYKNIYPEKIIEILPGNKLGSTDEKSFSGGNLYPWPESKPKDEPIQVITLSYKEQRSLNSRFVASTKDHLLTAYNYHGAEVLLAQMIRENREAILRMTENLSIISYKINFGQGIIGNLVNQSNLIDHTNEILEELVYFTNDTLGAVEAVRETDAAIKQMTVTWSIASVFVLPLLLVEIRKIPGLENFLSIP